MNNKNTINKVLSVLLTLFSTYGIIASIISLQQPVKNIFLIICFSTLLIGLIWIANTYFEFSKAIRILNGAKTIGLINVKKNRNSGKNIIRQKIKEAKEIKIFAVSGQKVVEDFFEEFKIALSENQANMKFIFSMHGGNIVDEDIERLKNNLEKSLIYNEVLFSCEKLNRLYVLSKKRATELNKREGIIEVGFFDTHNRIPSLICDENYAAFHITLPPKESADSVFFEVIGGNQSFFYTEDKFINDLIINFDENWKYIKSNMQTARIQEYISAINVYKKNNRLVNYKFEQEKISSGTAYYFNNKKNERNYALGQKSNIFNHHFGIGRFNILPKSSNQIEILEEINQLEINQIEVLFKYLNGITTDSKLLDAGCGRGGTSIYIKQKFNPNITGINISKYQVDFANEIVKKFDLKNIVFKNMNYLNLDFEDRTFDYIILNEVTQYALNLEILFEGLFRVLKKNGSLVIATWCMKENYSDENWAIKINEHYGLRMHTINTYLESLSKVGFTIVLDDDYSKDATPYFELREFWDMRSGVEPYFLQGFRENKLLYKYIKCEK